VGWCKKAGIEGCYVNSTTQGVKTWRTECLGPKSQKKRFPRSKSRRKEGRSPRDSRGGKNQRGAALEMEGGEKKGILIDVVRKAKTCRILRYGGRQKSANYYGKRQG